MNFASQMMNSVVQMMEFALKMLHCSFIMMNPVFQTRNAAHLKWSLHLVQLKDPINNVPVTFEPITKRMTALRQNEIRQHT